MRVTIKQRDRATVRLKAISYSGAAKETQAGAEGAANNGPYMTAVRTKQQIDARLATQAGAEAGTATTGLMNELRTKQSIEIRVPSYTLNNPAFGDMSDIADQFDAAIAFLAGIGGGNLMVPRGTFTPDRTVVVASDKINIIGQGRFATTFNVAFSGDVFRFKAASGRVRGGSLRSCSIAYTGGADPSSGYAIVFDGAGDCESHDVIFEGTYRGVGFINDNRNCRSFNCGGANTVDAEFYIDGGGNQHILLGTTFDASLTDVNQGVTIKATERADLNFFTSSHHGVSLLIQPGTGQLVQNVFASFPDLDASYGDAGLVIDPSATNSVVRGINISGGSFGASSGKGIWIKSGSGQVGDVKLNDLVIQSNVEEGAYFQKGRIRLNGVCVQRNGSGAGQSGIRIGSGCDVFRMNGGAIGQILGGPDTSPRPLSLENFQLYGLEVDSGFSGSASLYGVDLTGNITGPVINNSSTAIDIQDCPGWVGSKRGTAVIPVGSSFVTITPGVSFPVNTRGHVLVTPVSNPDNSGVETVFVGATTSTTFDIVTSPFLNVSGTDLGINWEIKTT